MDPTKIDEGRARRGRAQGAKHEALTEALASIDPRLATWADGWIFGEVWDDADGVDFGDRMVTAIVALAASGRSEQMRNYCHGALQDGVDPRRIHEALLMLPVYVGFPTALAALATWQEVVRSARRRGLDVPVPVS